MIQTHSSPLMSTSQHQPVKSYRFSILHKFQRRRKSSISSSEYRHKSSSSSPFSLPTSRQQLPSISGLGDALSDASIADGFSNLYTAVFSHVKTYYSIGQVETTPSQYALEHAYAGLAIPFPQLAILLKDIQTRQGALTLCISWTILSRSLLLKLGLSNSPGSTFLPPEIVECFQSFSLGKGPVAFDPHESNPVNFALLSRWKQITATLMHSTYDQDAFSHFDARTVNIERALDDLDPLLRIYAVRGISSGPPEARLADLRAVLRKGAKLAFTLFGQPYFWQFDWGPGADSPDVGSIREQFNPGGKSSDTVPLRTPSELVIWPSLLKIMDGDGMRIEASGEGHVFGRKMHLKEFVAYG